MATALQPAPAIPSLTQPHQSFLTESEQRIVFCDVGWPIYEALVDAIGEHQPIRLAHDGKDLEIMTKGPTHEDYRVLLGRLVDFVTEELDIACSGLGETTWKRPELARGIEADHCYYFQAEKLAQAASANARRSKDISTYPNPDLAVEVDISPTQVDRPGIFAALQVVEVWRLAGLTVVIEKLQPDGTYAAVESSCFLPIRAEEIRRWVVDEDTSNKTAWARKVRQWVGTELLQRPRPRESGTAGE
jgi:Uma2 family endonuclease